VGIGDDAASRYFGAGDKFDGVGGGDVADALGKAAESIGPGFGPDGLRFGLVMSSRYSMARAVSVLMAELENSCGRTLGWSAWASMKCLVRLESGVRRLSSAMVALAACFLCLLSVVGCWLGRLYRGLALASLGIENGSVLYSVTSGLWEHPGSISGFRCENI
jgi:hypothetical protein